MKNIILFAFLAVVTIFCHTFIERYEKSGPEMLTGTWKANTPQIGGTEIKDNELVLFSSDQSNNVNIQQDIPSFEHGSILNLSADMKVENVLPGEKPWNRARLLLVQHDGKKDRWDLPHALASFSGTKEWDSYSRLFTISPVAQTLRVTAQLSHCTGSFQLKNIRLFPVSQTRGYTWAKRSIFTSWGLFSLILLGSCFSLGNKQPTLQVILVLAFIAIIIGTTMPKDMKKQVLTNVKDQIHATSDVFEDKIPWDLSKIGHFCFFAVFGLIISLLLTREPSIRVMIHILLLAGGTELAQLYIDGRTPLFWDFGIDTLGGLSGIVLIKLFGRRRWGNLT